MPSQSRRLPYVLQLRLSPVQRAYLVFRATRDGIGLAEVVRKALEEAIARETLPQDPEQDPTGQMRVPLRPLLEGMDKGAIERAASELGAHAA